MAENAIQQPVRTSTDQFRVGDLHVDLERGEIRRGTDVTHLGGQPLAILAALLRSPLHHLGRDDLQARLWPEDEHGDLDERLNAAVRLLRRSLGDAADDPRYLETLRGRGYRICAEIESLEPTPVAGGHERSSRRWTPVLLVLGLLLVGFIVSERLQNPAQREQGPLRVALPPFEVIGDDPQLETLAAVLENQLTTRIARLAPRRIELIGRDSSARFTSDRGSNLGRPIDILVEGRLTASEPLVPRLFLHVSSVDSGAVVWSRELDAARPVSAWFPELSRGLATVSDSLPHDPGPDPGTSSAEAYTAYVAAMRAARGDDLEAAEARLREALDTDPYFSQAYVLLGRVQAARARTSGLPARDDLTRAKSSFRRAIELDPGLADAHLGLAGVQLYGFWDWSAAESSYLTALDAAPGRAETHHAYAWFLLASRRFEEARSTMDRALELDPFAPVLHSDLGWFHYRVRDYPGALRLCHTALDLDPELGSALDCRHRALARLGQFGEALEQGLAVADIPEAKRQELLSEVPADGYRDYLLYLEETRQGRDGLFVSAMNLAAGGRYDSALDRLEAAVVEREGFLVLIDVTPEFDPLVSDPRFGAVRRRVMERSD